MKYRWVLLFLILLVATGMRFHGLGAKSLWLDESLSWRLQTFPVSLLVERTGESSTVHPPLYFLLLRSWTYFFGESEFALRSLAASGGVLMVGGMFLLVRELMYFWPGNPETDVPRMADRAGLVAAAITAVNGFQICLSQQVRGYSLGTFFLVAGSWVLLRALRAERRYSAAGWWCGYAVLALAFCYTHHLALFSVAAQGVFAVCYVYRARFRKRDVTAYGHDVGDVSAQTEPGVLTGLGGGCQAAGTNGRWLVLAGALLMLGYCPWVSNLFGQSESVRTSWSTRPLGIQTCVDEVYTAVLLTPAQPTPDSGAFGWCVVIVLGAVIGFVATRGGWAGFFILCAACLPVLLILLYCELSIRSIFRARYFAFAQPIWLAAFACAVASFRSSAERRLLISLTLLWFVYSFGNTWDFIGPHSKPGMRSATAFVLDKRSGDEMVVSQTPFEFFKLLYYMRHTSRPVLCVAKPDRHAQRGTAQLLDTDLMTPEEILQAEPKELWLVTSAAYDASHQMDLPLPDEWREIERRHFLQDFYPEKPITVKHYRRE